MKIGSTLDWFVAENARDSLIDQTRSKILAGVGLLFGFLILLNVIRAIKIGNYQIAIVIGVCAIAI